MSKTLTIVRETNANADFGSLAQRCFVANPTGSTQSEQGLHLDHAEILLAMICDDSAARRAWIDAGPDWKVYDIFTFQGRKVATVTEECADRYALANAWIYDDSCEVPVDDLLVALGSDDDPCALIMQDLILAKLANY